MRGDNARRLRAQFRTVTSPEIHRRNHAPANPFPCCIVRVFAAATANMRRRKHFNRYFSPQYVALTMPGLLEPC